MKKSIKTLNISKGLSVEEISAMKDYLKEKNLKINNENAVIVAISKMNEPDRSLAKQIHNLIKSKIPNLSFKTWYGMPAYTKDDKIICFFQNAGKFKARYSTLGFTDKANLDEGKMWPTSFAITTLSPKEEAKIIALIKKAVN
ncbi:MAG: DUF1801 domain-containing protein [Candidatus Micrarchaeaceae archaeon]